MKGQGRVLAIYLLIATSAIPAVAHPVPATGPAVQTDTDPNAGANKVVRAVRIDTPIILDGYLDEAAWRSAQPATDFIQRVPNTGEPAVNQTEARFLYDDRNLYIGVICHDIHPDQIVVNELTDDFNFGQSDAINIVIDSLFDRRSGFQFMTNPAGARRDGQTANDGGSNNIDWDGVWDVRTSRTSDGWVAELVIPFTTLRFSNAPSQVWGLNITRAVRSQNEESTWAAVPFRYRASRMSLAGTLEGIEGIQQGLNLSVKPFVTAGVTRTRVGDQLVTLRSLSRLGDYDGGVDLKYNLTPSVTLDATYRTDFAQVEVDQQQVNLTRFSLFFPEKRDFFLENSSTFSFGPGGNFLPFFSRRIGLSDDGSPIPILGGARVTGQVGRYDVGLLAMKTEAEDADPVTGREATLSNDYLVGRVKRKLLGNSWVGALVTSRSSELGDDHNRVYGADAHFQFFTKLEFDSYLLKSSTPGLSGQDQARRFQTAWRDDELLISAEYNQYQANFNPELGYLRRGRVSQYTGEFTWSPLLRNSESVRNLTFGTTLDYYADPGGTIESRNQDLRMGVQFENGASVDAALVQNFERINDPNTRIRGIPIPLGDYRFQSYMVDAQTNPTRKIIGNAGTSWGQFWGGRRTSVSGGATWRPNLHLSTNFTYTRDSIHLQNGSSISDLVGTRFVYGFTPNAFFNTFFQYNGATREFSTNIRFNIRYRPLSDFYIVYNDRRDTANGVALDRAFIVKLTRLVSF